MQSALALDIDKVIPGPGYDPPGFLCLEEVYGPMSGYKGHCVIRSGFVSPTLPCFAYIDQSILFNNPCFMFILTLYSLF